MRIGISILTRDGHNVWSNGIDQNVYHLACLLRSLPFVEKVVLLDCGNLGLAPHYAGGVATQFEIIPLIQVEDSIDIAIEVSGALDIEWANRFRARGGKVVSYLCGQPYAGLVDPTTFARPGFFSKPGHYDEIWVLPKDAIFANMMGSIYRCPVFEMPYLWASVFLDNLIENVQQNGGQFGYQAGTLLENPMQAAIFEPNISPIKMGIIPFLICEQIERITPERVKTVYFMNSAAFASHPTFVSIVGNSGLYKSGKASLENRDYFVQVMARGGNMVVSHQITCQQNYLYLDTLYGNYPLVHNSPLFSDVGYYYPDSDILAGAEQVRLVLREHDHNLASYQQKAAAKIASLSPYNSFNQRDYARKLMALGQSPKKDNSVWA